MNTVELLSSTCSKKSANSIPALDLAASILRHDLPFYPHSDGTDPLLNWLVDELLEGNCTRVKHGADGFLGFHSLKICSSNARQLSKYLQLTMGFREIACRGLETDSRLIGAHVIRNGNILFEIVNTLETVEDDLTPQFEANPQNIRQTIPKSFVKGYKTTANELVSDIVCRNSTNSSSLGSKIYQKLIHSRRFKKTLSDYAKVLSDSVDTSERIYNDLTECALIQKFLKTHGEGIMDIAFLVEDVDIAFERAVRAGAGYTRIPKVIADEFGSVKLATVIVPGTDINHTLIQNIDYTGAYLPHYSPVAPPTLALPEISLHAIDHCVENYTWNQMMDLAKLYAQMFGFHKFWSVDEAEVSTSETALRSIVMASANCKIKMPINEPAKGKKRSQIEEFHDYNGGPGVQHIALTTHDIIGTVSALRQRGIEFNTTKDLFYHHLEQRLKTHDVHLIEDWETLKSLNILIDFDPSTRNRKSKVCNYILQIFTKPLHDRPTLFIEIIQRHHHNGFGKGTFKGLFETIEEQQRLRGTLDCATTDDVFDI